MSKIKSRVYIFIEELNSAIVKHYILFEKLEASLNIRCEFATVFKKKLQLIVRLVTEKKHDTYSQTDCIYIYMY